MTQTPTSFRSRHETGTALVTADHQLYVRKVDESIGQRQIALPRYAIGDIDTMLIEGGGKDIGSGFRHNGLFPDFALKKLRLTIYSDWRR